MPGEIIEIRQPVLDYLRGIADERNRQDRARGCKHKRNITGDNAMRKGVMGEYAYCVWTGIDYTQFEFINGTFADDDDINGVQIRATASAWQTLITRTNDKPAPYVLVTLDRRHADLVVATLRGWAWLSECNVPERRLPKFDFGDTLVYSTPPSALHPMSTLTVIYN